MHALKTTTIINIKKLYIICGYHGKQFYSVIDLNKNNNNKNKIFLKIYSVPIKKNVMLIQE